MKSRAGVLGSVFASAVFLVLLSPAAAAGEFPDVPKWHWAWSQIQGVSDRGICGGFPDGTYRPGVVVTRDQMAVYIARGLAESDRRIPTGPLIPTFSDVPGNHWAYKYIEYCAHAARDVVDGFPDGTYRPSLPVARDAMAVYIARALVRGDERVPDGPPEATFPDVPTGHWAYKHIEYCADPAQGVVDGFPDGTYRPELEVTRDQMAVYVCRAFHLATPSQPYNVTDYFPLGDSDTWSYDSSRGFYTQAVSGTVDVSGTECKRLTTSLGLTSFWAPLPDGLRVGGFGDGTNTLTLSPLLALPNGLSPGDQGSQDVASYLNGTSAGTVSLTYQFLGPESVTVPAGAFADCMKLDLAVTYEGETYRFFAWVARDVGVVVADSRPFGGTEWEVLVSADVGGVTYPAPSPAYAIADYFPLRVGDHRALNTPDGVCVEETVGVEPVAGLEAARIDMGPPSDGEIGRSYYRHDNGALALAGRYDPAVGSLMTFSPPITLPATVRLGDHGTQTAQVEVGGAPAGSITFDWAVVGAEAVTVPAGTFHDCLKLHTHITGPEGDEADSLEWYAAGIGLVKSDERPLGGSGWKGLAWARIAGIEYPIAGRTFDITDYCDLSLGNTWRYGDGPAWTVTDAVFEDAQRWAVITATGADIPSYYQQEDAGGLHYLGWSGGIAGEMIRFDPPLRIPNGLAPGDSGTQVAVKSSHGVSVGNTTFRYTFTGIEPVRTDAGVFPDSMRFEVTVDDPDAPPASMTLWFARAVGLARQEIADGWSAHLSLARVAGVSYPAGSAEFAVTDYYPLVLGNYWAVRFEGESSGAEQVIANDTVEVGELGISDTVLALSHLAGDELEGADLMAATSAGLMRYGYADPGTGPVVAQPGLLVANGIRVGDSGSTAAALYQWSGSAWVLLGPVDAAWELAAAGPVGVSAGYFPDCVLVKETIAQADLGTSTTYTWLARGVGPVLSYEVGGAGEWSELMGATILGERVPEGPLPASITRPTIRAGATIGLDISSGLVTTNPGDIDVSYVVVGGPPLRKSLQAAVPGGLSRYIGWGSHELVAYREYGSYLPAAYNIWGSMWGDDVTVADGGVDNTGGVLVVKTREGRYALLRVIAVDEAEATVDVVYPYGEFLDP